MSERLRPDEYHRGLSDAARAFMAAVRETMNGPETDERIIDAIDKARDRVVAERDELRALLAKVLDGDHWLSFDGDAGAFVCLFCERYVSGFKHEAALHLDHAPGCPVLSKDRLLGRG